MSSNAGSIFICAGATTVQSFVGNGTCWPMASGDVEVCPPAPAGGLPSDDEQAKTGTAEITARSAGSVDRVIGWDSFGGEVRSKRPIPKYEHCSVFKSMRFCICLNQLMIYGFRELQEGGKAGRIFGFSSPSSLPGLLFNPSPIAGSRR